MQPDILRGLCADLAVIHDRKEFMSVIYQRCKEFIPLSRHWIATINEDQLTINSFPDEEDPNKYPISDGIVNKVLLSREPVVFDLEVLAARGVAPGYLERLAGGDVKNMIMVPLQVGRGVIGVWGIGVGQGRETDGDLLALIGNVSLQLALTVYRWRADDAIHARDTEIRRMQRLSSAIGVVRDKTGLLSILNDLLCPLFRSDSVMIIVCRPGYFSSGLLLVSGESSPSDIGSACLHYQDYCFQKVRDSGEIVAFDMEQLLTRTDAPVRLFLEYKRGAREKIGIALRNGGEMLGVLYINVPSVQYYSDTELALIKGIVSQLSVAIAGVLAVEEVNRRTTEVELLLSFSLGIPAVKDRREWPGLINEWMREMPGFRGNNIIVVNEDGVTATDGLGSYTTGDGILELSPAGEPTKVFDLACLGERQGLPAYLEPAFACGAGLVCVCRLLRGNDIIGFWMLFFDGKALVDEGKIRLINGLAGQLSSAVAGSIALERLTSRLLHPVEEEESIFIGDETVLGQDGIIGRGRHMQKIFYQVKQVAPSDSTVLLLGETGTGKELIARAIHDESPRRDGPMVRVNCAAMPENLIESELFGHEKGSFTNAFDQRIGKFEQANKGTLFLDEIGEMPPELQTKLLRALQEREIERIGGRTTIRVDVRVIAATNRDLEQEMAAGRFRADLFFRLNIFPIRLPALRERKEDIPLLIAHFIRMFCNKTGKRVMQFSRRTLRELIAYDWPGNVREMEHFIERSMVLSSGNTLKRLHLTPQQMTAGYGSAPHLKTIAENERDHILAILEHCGGYIAGPRGAAAILGLPPSTLNSRMKRLGIKREHIGR